jgi:Sulfatase-modifying factor enzyme 1/PKD domain
MKNLYLRFFLRSFLAICLLILGINACSLDKEIAIPTGANNEKDAIFISADVSLVSNDSVRANARITRGNLDILKYGWAWSQNPSPTLKDSFLSLASLSSDAFPELIIPKLAVGKTYHFRPFVMTGSGEIYGPDKTLFMGIPKVGDVVLLKDSSCFFSVQTLIQSPQTLLAYGIVYLKGAGVPSLEKDSIVLGSGINNGSFLTNLTMLSPSSSYSVRAYATTASGTGYSKLASLTTPVGALLTADFTINTDATLFEGAIVQFSNTSNGANAYSWNFGDGGTANQASVIHTFNTLGTMPVRLTTQKGGCVQAKDTILKIIADPFKNYWMPIPSGTFTMGCTAEQGADCKADESPAHQVTLSSFVIGKTEITQGQYKAVTGVNVNLNRDCGLDCPSTVFAYNRILLEFLPSLFRKTGRNHALPTEAQWEYAARGGASAANMTKYAGSNLLDTVGWYQKNGTYAGSPVAQKLPNGYGLYDMSGNLSECCSDWYGSYSAQPQTNPTGPASGYYRVIRGGSSLYNASLCRVSARDSLLSTSFNNIGFRIIRLP